jgi:hypothetical protein
MYVFSSVLVETSLYQLHISASNEETVTKMTGMTCLLNMFEEPSCSDYAEAYDEILFGSQQLQTW